jgi:diguanylate cyclase (GGDEF)-like protein
MQILIVNDHLTIADLSGDTNSGVEITTTTTGKDGLAALAQCAEWCAVLVASKLPDMDGMAFLQETATLSEAIPLLLVPDGAELAQTLQQANSCSIFRIVPETTPAETLASIFLDAVKQFRLLQQEQRLREQINQLTIIDPLTGCFSRTHLEDTLKKELLRSIRYAHPLSIILCDIDALKGCNESFGHHVGDHLLKGFAQTAMHHIRRDIDTITRWGEDEFLLVLAETPLRGAGRVASRLCEQFAERGYASEGNQVFSTASFGVAGYSPEMPNRNTTIEDLLLAADRSLVQAKAAGGNQVLCCP